MNEIADACYRLSDAGSFAPTIFAALMKITSFEIARGGVKKERRQPPLVNHRMVSTG